MLLPALFFALATHIPRNFEAYEEDKRRRLGGHATDPHRVTFRKFQRG